jgi:hypothetical protein
VERIGWIQRHPDHARLFQWYCDLVEYRAKHDRVRFFVFDPILPRRPDALPEPHKMNPHRLATPLPFDHVSRASSASAARLR